MTPYTLHLGDCLDVLPMLGPVASIVTDPPAGISFMGAEWDKDKGGRDAWVAWLAARLRAAAALLPPGGAALVWALPRTSHWTALAIEEAGLRVDDRLSHIFGSGFPKHKSKLKPAVEDWWLARKPGGAGWLNIDGCRVEGDVPTFHRFALGNGIEPGAHNPSKRTGEMSAAGRYPPHLLLSHAADCAPGACVEDCPVAVLGAQSGESASKRSVRARAGDLWFNGDYNSGEQYATKVDKIGGHNDTGTAARFFPQFWPDGDEPPFIYAAKASRRERNAGCEGLEERASGVMQDDAYKWQYDGKGNKINLDTQSANHHPTVKSQALMRWLVRLVTPPGGVVLDPFCGSGSTGVAALGEGFGFVGIEQSAEYLEIARARIAHAAGPLFAEEAA